jgi:hypothetical protein
LERESICFDGCWRDLMKKIARNAALRMATFGCVKTSRINRMEGMIYP